MKEAMFYEKHGNKSVQCRLCPRNCIINENKRGNCRVRENRQGKLFSLSYASPCAAAVDPIEKKPLFHFLPGTYAYSIGTAGCNLHCKFCQNWSTAQAFPEDVISEHAEPKDVVNAAVKAGCKSIAYTYNEPIVFYEYALDTAKLAKKKGLKNVIVSNGFIQQEPLVELCKYIDGANIDLKGFTDDFYRKTTTAWLEPVLETLKTINKKKTWLEITNLIIPKHNDSMNTIKKMCEWIVKELGNNVPIHFSGFYPAYNMKSTSPTPVSTLTKAYDVAKKSGINHVYIGNVRAEKESSTYCPKCGELAIERKWFEVSKNNLKSGKCQCGEKILGVWK